MTALEIFVRDHQALSYLIVLLGMFIEADIFFLTAAVFADQKHLNWGILMAVAFTGVVLGDIALYYIGKHSRDSRFGLWISEHFRRYHEWLDSNLLPRYYRLVFFTKFLYYVNRLMPFLAGWHKVEEKKFLKMHLAADLSWLAVMTAIGTGLSVVVNLVGPKWVLERIWVFFLILAVIFIGGEYFVKRMVSKKLTGNNGI